MYFLRIEARVLQRIKSFRYARLCKFWFHIDGTHHEWWFDMGLRRKMSQNWSLFQGLDHYEYEKNCKNRSEFWKNKSWILQVPILIELNAKTLQILSFNHRIYLIWPPVTFPYLKTSICPWKLLKQVYSDPAGSWVLRIVLSTTCSKVSQRLQ